MIKKYIRKYLGLQDVDAEAVIAPLVDKVVMCFVAQAVYDAIHVTFSDRLMMQDRDDKFPHQVFVKTVNGEDKPFHEALVRELSGISRKKILDHLDFQRSMNSDGANALSTAREETEKYVRDRTQYEIDNRITGEKFIDDIVKRILDKQILKG